MPTRSPPAEDDTHPNITPEEDESSESEPDAKDVAHHLTLLSEHCNETKSHLFGVPEYEDEEPGPSYFAPNTCWTAQEKNMFFHALSVHSRLRPDVIAEEIGTKSLAEVCTYITMLEEGLRSSERNDPEFFPVPRERFPTAYEVSEKWVEFEDELAEAAMRNEPEAYAQALRNARDEELREQRLELRAPYRPKGERAKGRDREGEKARKNALKERIKERELAWSREDILNSLNLGLMRSMDMLVREAEEARATAPEDETTGQRSQDTTSPSPDTLSHGKPTDTMDLDDEFIDPSLRSSSAPTRVQTPPLDDEPRPRTPGQSVSVHDNFDPLTPPFSRLQPTASSSTLMDPDRNALPVAVSTSEEAPLSPAARRRMRKRMYMRRKRAEASGGAVDQSTARLKPGRRKLKLPKETDDPDEPTRHPRRSGKTLTYRMREQLDAAGITPEWMQDENLDLFHMTGLYKLMRSVFILLYRTAFT